MVKLVSGVLFPTEPLTVTPSARASRVKVFAPLMVELKLVFEIALVRVRLSVNVTGPLKARDPAVIFAPKLIPLEPVKLSDSIFANPPPVV